MERNVMKGSAAQSKSHSAVRSKAVQPYDLKLRTKEFALRVIRLFNELPRGAAPYVLGKQVLRSATSVGANYREAVRARSPQEYSAKTQLCTQELEETKYWLELVEGAGYFKPEALAPLQKEVEELLAIFFTLVKKGRATANKG